MLNCEVFCSFSVEKLRAWLQNLKFKIQNLRRGTTRVSPMFIQFTDFFWYDKYLTFLGYSVLNESQRSQKWQKNLCLGTMVVSVIYAIVIVFSFVRSVMNLMDGNNLFIVMENMAELGAFFIVALKWYILLYQNHDTILKIIDRLDQHYPHSGLDQIDFNTEKHLRWLQKITNFHIFMIWMTLEDFSLIPLLHQLYGLLRSQEIEWSHAFEINLPFDTMHGIFYWSNLFYVLCIMFFCGLIFSSTDALYASLTHLVSMELNNLAQILSEIDWDDEDEEGEKKAIEEMKKLAGIHQQLIEVTEELNKIFSPSLFVNAFGSLLVVCTVAFLVVSGKGHYFLLKYIFPLVFALWYFYIQCQFGHSMTDASLRIVEGVYNSPWYKASPKYRKLALMIMLRAQKSQKLTGWKFVDINLETYYWYIKTAHSYSSFLSGVYKS